MVCTRTLARTSAVSVALLGLGAGTALGGGFAVREQSALSEGSAFAGSAANGQLSSMFWNSAGVTTMTGTNVDANVSAIFATAIETAEPGSSFVPATGAPQSADIARNGYVPAIYLNHQLTGYDPNMFIGLGVNSGFGLKTQPDKVWAGSNVASSTSLFTTNFNPVLGYKFSDQVSFAVGAQLEFAKGVLKFATGVGPNGYKGPNTAFEGEDFAFGATAGLLWTPAPATRIGLGWRSALTHQLDGQFFTNGSPTGSPVLDPALNIGIKSKVELRLPDIVTLSLNQGIATNLRALGTVEWTNWSRFGGLEIVSTGSGRQILNPFVTTPAGASIARINAPWDDGWFFSGGLEYDVSQQLTVRAGGAYELSPVTTAAARLAQIPDADRVWASAGFTYNVSPSTALDFGYSHLFVDSVQLSQKSPPSVFGQVALVAGLEADIDIISVGLRMKLGGQ